MKTRYRILDVPVTLNRVRVVRVKDRELKAMLGPLDFPGQLRVGLERVEKGCVSFIEFLYDAAPDERVRVLDAGGGAHIEVGLNSGRIMRIVSPAPRQGARARLEVSINKTEQMVSDMRKEETALLQAEPRPVRRAAYYDMLSDLLPGMESRIADEVQKLRAAVDTVGP